MNTQVPPLLTARELATELRVCLATVRRWTNAGRIPKVALSPRLVRYSKAAVMAALAAEATKTGEVRRG